MLSILTDIKLRNPKYILFSKTWIITSIEVPSKNEVFNKVFSTRLKQARTAAGLSQKELGLRIGITCSSASGRMNHYEKGRHLPDMATLAKMAEELNVPIAYFFCESDDMAKLVTLFSKMSEEERVECLKSLKQSNKL